MSDFLTSREVCARARVSWRQLNYWIERGWIEGQGRVGSGAVRRWTPTQLERIIEIRETFDRVEAILRHRGLEHPTGVTRPRRVRGAA